MRAPRHGGWVLCVLAIGFSLAAEARADLMYLDSFGSYRQGPGQLSGPDGIAVSDDGFVYIADTYNSRVQKFTLQGQYVSSFGGSGTGVGTFSRPYGIDVDASGDVYVGDLDRSGVQKFDPAGNYVATIGAGDIQQAFGLWVADNGALYVTDRPAHLVRRYAPDGAALAAWGPFASGETTASPQDIEGDGQGRFYVSIATGRFPPLSVLDVNGEEIGVVRPYGTPSGGALASGMVFLSQYNANVVSIVRQSDLQISGSVSSGGGIAFQSPFDCATDGHDLVLVLDTGNNRVARFQWSNNTPASVGGTPAITSVALETPWPSPAQGAFRTAFALPREAHARLSLFDVLGREAALLVDDRLAAGRHLNVWSGAPVGRLPSGLYFVRLAVEGERPLVRRLVVSN